MQTECPHCHTVFHVKTSELSQADCQVRCGHCLAVFTAEDPLSLIQYPEVDSVAPLEEAPKQNEHEQNEQQLHEQEVGEPSRPAADTSAPLNLAMGSELGLNLGSEENEGTHTVADVIPPELRAEDRKAKTHTSLIKTALLALFILAGIIAGLLQYAYYNHESLIKNASLRPWFQTGCELIGCTLPQPEDSTLIFLSNKNIFTHPNTESALMVSASIINQAEFAQRYPIIELRFNNVRGEVIAARRFSAQEYLGIPVEQISQMQPDIPVNISLEIKDPGSEMISYDFDFL
ncbi:hypothetical protein MNBD_GAMMA10-446 [hydrothermal vent metagenome]|uniref:Zinc finger/thioredoxin putative domain-containing protein n=1 Tax=hydrothermal vent metagenome TaxID=652676 RepID=A0A3B0Y5A6_9ZZZZ